MTVEEKAVLILSMLFTGTLIANAITTWWRNHDE